MPTLLLHIDRIKANRELLLQELHLDTLNTVIKAGAEGGWSHCWVSRMGGGNGQREWCGEVGQGLFVVLKARHMLGKSLHR